MGQPRRRPDREGPELALPDSFIAAWVLLIVFSVAEKLLRRDAAARSIETGPEDRGTMRRIGLAFAACVLLLLASPALDRTGVGVVDTAVGWVGVAIMAAGLGLRVWAALALGRYYTRTLRLASDQRVVRRGPYRLIRHPGYAGDIVLWLGAAIASRSLIVLALAAAALALAYLPRIAAEESMLLAAFGDDYRSYAKRSWRLIPFVY